MGNFSKNITRILTIIISTLVAYIIIICGLMIMRPQDKKYEQGAVLEKVSLTDGTPTDATSSDASPLDAVKPDLNSKDTIKEVSTKTDANEREPQKLPRKASIEMELVYQHPELPTGCESVALTMLLKYYGFELDKTTIARDYLIYSDNFVEGYMGNPFTTGGAGIYSPGLTRTANEFLDAKGSKLNAKNVTDSTSEELYRFIAQDTPVVIWNTVYFLPNQPTGLKQKWGEKTYEWDGCEHCMVLTGYDLDRNIVIVHDPIEGIVERDADSFWQKYKNLGSMAIIIS